MSYPKLSIITINYNQKDFLEETINSVLEQDYPNLEYIIIDGGSTDGSIEVIKKYEERLAYWSSEADNGIYHALNKGIAQVTGDWFNFMNSGDLFSSEDSLSIFQKNLDKKKVVVFSDLLFLDENGMLIKKEQKGLFKCSYLLNQLNHQSIFFNTAKARCLKYNDIFEIAADLDLIVKLYLKHGKESFLRINQQYLVIYRLGGFSSKRKEQLLLERRTIIKKLPPLYKYLSLLYQSYRGY